MDGWVEQAIMGLSFDFFLLGGPIHIKTNIDLREASAKKWPLQLVKYLPLCYDEEITSHLPFRMICSSNVIVSFDNFKNLNKDKVRIGYIGEGKKVGNLYYLDNGLIYNERMGVNCDIKY